MYIKVFEICGIVIITFFVVELVGLVIITYLCEFACEFATVSMCTRNGSDLSMPSLVAAYPIKQCFGDVVYDALILELVVSLQHRQCSALDRGVRRHLIQLHHSRVRVFDVVLIVEVTDFNMVLINGDDFKWTHP